MRMELVVDTNIVISAILKEGITRSLVFRPDVQLVCPKQVVEEIGKHRKELLGKSGADEENMTLPCAWCYRT